MMLCGKCPGILAMDWGSRCCIYGEQLTCHGHVDMWTAYTTRRKEERLPQCAKKPRTRKECRELEKREEEKRRALPAPQTDRGEG